MRRRVIALGLAAAAAATTLGLAAAPAEASGSYHLQYAGYMWPDQCAWYGQQGIAQHQWSAYYCETVVPTDYTRPGSYNLWVR